MVLFAEAGTGLVGFIGGSSNDKYIVGRSPRPVAVGYDPIEKVSDYLQTWSISRYFVKYVLFQNAE